MNFKVWKNIKKQFSSAKEKQVAIFRPKGDDESNEQTHLDTNMLSNHPPTESHMQQQSLSEQLVAGDQATKPVEAESIQNVPI